MLQAPFCVHPKTGKVCVPIDPQRSGDFDPDAVPTLSQLVAALSEDSCTASVRDSTCALNVALWAGGRRFQRKQTACESGAYGTRITTKLMHW